MQIFANGKLRFYSFKEEVKEKNFDHSTTLRPTRRITSISHLNFLVLFNCAVNSIGAFEICN